MDSFLAGESTPLFVGSALTNFGVRHVLDAIVDLAPGPSPRSDREGTPRGLDAPFSGFVFKVQANMDPSHRDRLAFVRVCSGRFERGMTVTREATGKPFATKYATSVFGAERDTIDEAYPGDVIGLVNAADLRIGDTLYAAEPVAYPAMPTFAPELFRQARPKDSSRFKQFRRGLDAAGGGGRHPGAAGRPHRGRRAVPGRRRRHAVRGRGPPARARVRRRRRTDLHAATSWPAGPMPPPPRRCGASSTSGS